MNKKTIISAIACMTIFVSVFVYLSISQAIMTGERPVVTSRWNQSNVVFANYNNEIYSAWLERKNDSTHLYLASSNDGGETWSLLEEIDIGDVAPETAGLSAFAYKDEVSLIYRSAEGRLLLTIVDTGAGAYSTREVSGWVDGFKIDQKDGVLYLAWRDDTGIRVWDSRNNRASDIELSSSNLDILDIAAGDDRAYILFQRERDSGNGKLTFAAVDPEQMKIAKEWPIWDDNLEIAGLADGRDFVTVYTENKGEVALHRFDKKRNGFEENKGEVTLSFSEEPVHNLVLAQDEHDKYYLVWQAKGKSSGLNLIEFKIIDGIIIRVGEENITESAYPAMGSPALTLDILSRFYLAWEDISSNISFKTNYPQNLSVSADSNGRTVLDWEKLESANNLEYNIYKSKGDDHTLTPDNIRLTEDIGESTAGIHLTWDKPTAVGEVAGYRIYRRNTPGERFGLLSITRQTNFTDDGSISAIPAGSRPAYIITAITDKAETLPSSIVTASIVVDAIGLGIADLGEEPPAISNAYYDRVVEPPYVDTNDNGSRGKYYSVSAVDMDNIVESPRSNIAHLDTDISYSALPLLDNDTASKEQKDARSSEEPLDNPIPPDAGDALRVMINEDGSLLLNWPKWQGEEATFSHYAVYRGENLLKDVPSIDSVSLLITQDDLIDGEPVLFKVAVIDTNNNILEEMITDIVMSHGDKIPPLSSRTVWVEETGSAGNPAFRLYWDPSQEYDLKEYRIYRRIKGGDDILIAVISPSESAVTPDLTTAGKVDETLLSRIITSLENYFRDVRMAWERLTDIHDTDGPKNEILIKFKSGVTTEEINGFLMDNGLKFADPKKRERLEDEPAEDWWAGIVKWLEKILNLLLSLINAGVHNTRDLNDLLLDERSAELRRIIGFYHLYSEEDISSFELEEYINYPSVLTVERVQFVRGLGVGYSGQEITLNSSLADDSVDVALIDTGLNTDKPLTITGWNFLTDTEDTDDDNGHGTSVASVIRSWEDDQFSINIVPLKVLNAEGIGITPDLANAITWAADHNIRIINISAGTKVNSLLVSEAVNYAASKGSLIIAGAGNDGEANLLYPAALNQVIGVSALDGEMIAGYSSYGSRLSFSDEGVDDGIIGTSVASANLAAKIAYLEYRYTGIEAGDFIWLLARSVFDLGPEGWDEDYGYGQVEIGKAEAIFEAYLVGDIVAGEAYIFPVQVYGVGKEIVERVDMTGKVSYLDDGLGIEEEEYEYSVEVVDYEGNRSRSNGMEDVYGRVIDAVEVGVVRGENGSNDVVDHFDIALPQDFTSATAGVTFEITITAKNANHDTVTSYTGQKTLTFDGPVNAPDGTSPLYPDEVTDTQGNQVTFFDGEATNVSITLYKGETVGLTVADADNTSIEGTSASITVNPGTADHFTVVAETPQTTPDCPFTVITAGCPFTITITAYDKNNNKATGYAGLKSLKIEWFPDGATEATNIWTRNVSFVDGVGNTDITLTKAEIGGLKVTDNADISITGTSASITVNPGPAVNFTVVAGTPQTAGNPFTVTITAYDKNNNKATGYVNDKSLKIEWYPTGADNATFSLVVTVSFTAGVGNTEITLNTAETGKLKVTDNADTSITGTSDPITVNPDNADHFFIEQPSENIVTASDSVEVKVIARDKFNNTDTNYDSSTILTVSDPNPNNPTGPNLKFVLGVTTTTVSLTTVGTTTLTVDADTDNNVAKTSEEITVTHAPVSKFKVEPNNLNLPAGTKNLQVTITARDPYNNIATDYNNSNTTLTFSGPSTAPDNTSPTVNGNAFAFDKDKELVTIIVDFNNATNGLLGDGIAEVTVALYKAETFRLKVEDASNSEISGESDNITVDPLDTVSSFDFVSEGYSPKAGTSFNVKIKALDEYWNTVTAYNNKTELIFTGTKKDNSRDTAPNIAPNTTDYPIADVTRFDNGLVTLQNVDFDEIPGEATVSMQWFNADEGGVYLTVKDFNYEPDIIKQMDIAINVEPTDIKSFNVNVPTPNPTSGSSFEVIITAIDQYGNVATGFGSSNTTVTFKGPGQDQYGENPPRLYFEVPEQNPDATYYEFSGETGELTLSNINFSGREEFGTSEPIGKGKAHVYMVWFNADEGDVSLNVQHNKQVEGASQAINVEPTGKDHFDIDPITPNQNPTAGSDYKLTITMHDQYHNRVTSYKSEKTSLTFSGTAFSESPNNDKPTVDKKPASNGSVTLDIDFCGQSGDPIECTHPGEATVTLNLYDANLPNEQKMLNVSDGSVSGNKSVTIVPASIETFDITTEGCVQNSECEQIAGVPFDVTLTALDPFGNVDTGFDGGKKIDFSKSNFGNAPNGDSPIYPESIIFQSGVGSGYVTLVKAEENKTLIVAYGDVQGSKEISVKSSSILKSFALSNDFEAIANGVLDSFKDVKVGEEFTMRITALDKFGNVMKGYNDSKRIIFSGPEVSPNCTPPAYPINQVSFGLGYADVNLILIKAGSISIGISLESDSSTIGTSREFEVIAMPTKLLVVDGDDKKECDETANEGKSNMTISVESGDTVLVLVEQEDNEGNKIKFASPDDIMLCEIKDDIEDCSTTWDMTFPEKEGAENEYRIEARLLMTSSRTYIVKKKGDKIESAKVTVDVTDISPVKLGVSFIYKIQGKTEEERKHVRNEEELEITVTITNYGDNRVDLHGLKPVGDTQELSSSDEVSIIPEESEDVTYSYTVSIAEDGKIKFCLTGTAESFGSEKKYNLSELFAWSSQDDKADVTGFCDDTLIRDNISPESTEPLVSACGNNDFVGRDGNRNIIYFIADPDFSISIEGRIDDVNPYTILYRLAEKDVYVDDKYPNEPNYEQEYKITLPQNLIANISDGSTLDLFAIDKAGNGADTPISTYTFIKKSPEEINALCTNAPKDVKESGLLETGCFIQTVSKPFGLILWEKIKAIAAIVFLVLGVGV